MVNKKRILGFVLLALLGAFFVIYMLFFANNKEKITINNNDKKSYKQKINLVAIGDSLTEGIGDSQKKQGYVKRVAKLIEEKYSIDVNTKNYGKAGDRSDQILKRLTDSDKMQQGIKDADVIIMTVGGNDLQQSLMKSVLVKNDGQLKKQLKKQERLYDENLNKLVKKIRELNPKSEIFLFGNYNPIYVHFPDREILNTSVKQFNAINVLVTKNYPKMHYISIFKQLTYGQYQSKKAQKELIQQVKQENADFEKNLDNNVAEIKNDYITSLDNFHPNNKGYNYMAKTLFDKMKKYNAWLLK